jgi:hypothetical protein
VPAFSTPWLQPPGFDSLLAVPCALEEIAHEIAVHLEPGDAIHLVDVLAQHGGVAELPTRGDVRLIARHPVAAIVIGERLQGRVDLQPHILVQASAALMSWLDLKDDFRSRLMRATLLTSTGRVH